MTTEKRMARAEELAPMFDEPRILALIGGGRIYTTEVATVLRGLVHDLRNAQQQVLALEHENWNQHVSLDLQIKRGNEYAGEVVRLSAELDAIKSQVVSAMSAAGPTIPHDEDLP